MTQIFKTYLEFLNRENKDVNGVNEEFAKNKPDFEKQNKSNKGCWNCSGCSDCSDCSRCSDLEKASPVQQTENNNAGFKVLVIENIHQKIYEAVSRPKALDMSAWHSCDTTHCRARWVTFIAGNEGKELEEKTSTLFAAQQIYKKSSSILVSPPRFFESNEKALADIKRCAEEEKAQS